MPSGDPPPIETPEPHEDPQTQPAPPGRRRPAVTSNRTTVRRRRRAAASTPGIDDEDLPEDLQPGEDNPLAEPLEPGETPEVDLNQPSSSYERELEERGEDGEDSDEHERRRRVGPRRVGRRLSRHPDLA